MLTDFFQFCCKLSRDFGTRFPAKHLCLNMFQEHFYDPVSHCGFIEIRLRNLRRSLHDDRRRYRKQGRSSELSRVAITLGVIEEGEDESIGGWITATKRMRPSPENLASIKMGMKKTFSNRRLWIQSQSPTVAEIFQQYPRFVDMPYLVSCLVS